jgi:hypothetical protein
MRNKTAIPAGTFKALFNELIPWSLIYALFLRCGVRRRRPPEITQVELIQGLVFHGVAEAGTLAQRRARLPPELFAQLMKAALKPKADPAREPEAFYQGLRLCGVDGSLFSVTNTPQVKQQMRKARSRRGRAAFPKPLQEASGDFSLGHFATFGRKTCFLEPMAKSRRLFSWAGERRRWTSERQFAAAPFATRNGLAQPTSIGAPTAYDESGTQLRLPPQASVRRFSLIKNPRKFPEEPYLLPRP